MVLPVAILVILTARYIAEGMLTRQEIGVHTRAATVNAASSRLPQSLSCTADRTGFNRKPGVRQTASVRCSDYRAEQGLRREKPFFRALRDGARAWPEMADTVTPRERISDVAGDGTGTFLLEKPDFLKAQGAVTSRQAFLIPQAKFWDHDIAPFAVADDRLIWRALRGRNVHQLFPRVFPNAGTAP